MDMTRTSPRERDASEASREEFLFLDVEEWGEPRLDWLHRDLLMNRDGSEISLWSFFRTLVYLTVFPAIMASASGGWLDFGPALPFTVPSHAGLVAFPLLLIAAFLVSRRETGTLASRIGVRDRLFEIVSKKGKTITHIPAERVKCIEIPKKGFGHKTRRMILIDTDSHRHTIARLVDVSRLDAFGDFCRRIHIDFAPRTGLSPAMWLLCVGMVLVVATFVADNKHPFPAAGAFLGVMLLDVGASFLAGKITK